MRQLTSVSDDAKQSMTTVLDNGDKVTVGLEYISSQKGWFISVGYGTILTANGRRVVTSPNMLRAFRDTIPFGIACTVKDGQEPLYQDDFTAGRATLWILNPDEVQDVEDSIVPAYRT